MLIADVTEVKPVISRSCQEGEITGFICFIKTGYDAMQLIHVLDQAHIDGFRVEVRLDSFGLDEKMAKDAGRIGNMHFGGAVHAAPGSGAPLLPGSGAPLLPNQPVMMAPVMMAPVSQVSSVVPVGKQPPKAKPNLPKDDDDTEDVEKLAAKLGISSDMVNLMRKVAKGEKPKEMDVKKKSDNDVIEIKDDAPSKTNSWRDKQASSSGGSNNGQNQNQGGYQAPSTGYKKNYSDLSSSKPSYTGPAGQTNFNAPPPSKPEPYNKGKKSPWSDLGQNQNNQQPPQQAGNQWNQNQGYQNQNYGASQGQGNQWNSNQGNQNQDLRSGYGANNGYQGQGWQNYDNKKVVNQVFKQGGQFNGYNAQNNWQNQSGQNQSNQNWNGSSGHGTNQNYGNQAQNNQNQINTGQNMSSATSNNSTWTPTTNDTIYFRQLPSTMTSPKLKRMMETFGVVEFVDYPMGPNNQPLGYAYCKFAAKDASNATYAAVSRYNGADVEGSVLEVGLY